MIEEVQLGIQTAEAFGEWLEQLQIKGNQVKSALVFQEEETGILDVCLEITYGSTAEALTGFPIVSLSLTILGEAFLYYVEAALAVANEFEGAGLLTDMLALVNQQKKEKA
ncbi:hypothetical protein ACULLB_09740 [Enterococcus gallinarum]|uniref:hypothetical protein n=1 Tax=Enterococcus gallinarum TaxID=1353 RepID=UPI00403FFA9F